MKRILAVLLIVVLLTSVSACGKRESEAVSVESGSAATAVEAAAADGEFFEWSPMPGHETEIIGYSEEGLKQKTLVIPENCTSVQGLQGNTVVEHISFANPDTWIEATTFSGCTSLKTVELPANLPELENDVFNDCSGLTAITIPETVTEIGSDAFWSCTALESVTLNDKLTVIGRQAFCECTSLKKVEIPDSVTEIKKAAFEKCTALDTVDFGTGVSLLGESAFEGCTSLKSVVIPEGVTELDVNVFAFCDALEEIYIHEGVTYADPYAIAQIHTVKVYVVEGSYMDGRIAELVSPEYLDKQYQ